MKPHPRIRRTAMWGGLAATVLLAAAWIGSAWWYAQWVSDNGRGMGIGAGYVVFARVSPVGGKHLFAGPMPLSDRGEFGWSFALIDTTGRWQLFIPGWALVLPIATSAAFAWRLDTLARRRSLVGHCLACGYDLRGLPAGAGCPECGAGSKKA